ncbi:MAG TPA: hypothetical protein V6C88_08975 [Chroococcidiopsis sp.]
MLIGFALVIGAFAYLGLTIAQVIAAFRAEQPDGKLLRILQLIFAPICLLVSGGILVFQGWRQDAILQLKDLLMAVLIAYLIAIDVLKSRRS